MYVHETGRLKATGERGVQKLLAFVWLECNLMYKGRSHICCSIYDRLNPGMRTLEGDIGQCDRQAE